MINKEAIDYLMEQGINPQERVIKEVDSDGNKRSFIINKEGQAQEIKPLQNNAKEPLHLSTLTSFIDYVKNIDKSLEHLYIHIENEKQVSLLGQLDQHGYREHLATTTAIIPNFTYDRFHDVEELIIAMQSTFVQTKDRDIILKVIGNIKEENIRNTGDTGISQSVTMKIGVTQVEDVKVPNPVSLAPYRTFSEVKQPESDFVFRMKDGPTGAIFEADGGAWRNKAIFQVKTYLIDNLEELIKNKKITILA